jgi:hypothetical protein
VGMCFCVCALVVWSLDGVGEECVCVCYVVCFLFLCVCVWLDGVGEEYVSE